MNSKSKEELVEQYEDAAFALLMSEYAEMEGNRLLQEFEEAKARGEVPEIPNSLDAKCRKMIRQAYEKEQRKVRINKFVKNVGRIAAAFFVSLGICTTLVFSVEALRTPFVNFLIEQHERFTSIDFDREATEDPTQDTNPVPTEETEEGSPLDAFVPEGYTLSVYTVRDDGTVVILYENAEGNSVYFSTTASEGNLNLDTEEADSEIVEIAGFSGIFVNKDGVLTIMWFNGETERAHQLRTMGLDMAEFWVLAQHIANTNIGG